METNLSGAAACGPSPAPGCSAKNRFAFDEESGFVIDRETGEWLTTAEEVFDAMIQHMPNPAVEGRREPTTDHKKG